MKVIVLILVLERTCELEMLLMNFVCVGRAVFNLLTFCLSEDNATITQANWLLAICPHLRWLYCLSLLFHQVFWAQNCIFLRFCVIFDNLLPFRTNLFIVFFLTEAATRLAKHFAKVSNAKVTSSTTLKWLRGILHPCMDEMEKFFHFDSANRSTYIS